MEKQVSDWTALIKAKLGQIKPAKLSSLEEKWQLLALSLKQRVFIHVKWRLI